MEQTRKYWISPREYTEPSAPQLSIAFSSSSGPLWSLSLTMPSKPRVTTGYTLNRVNSRRLQGDKKRGSCPFKEFSKDWWLPSLWQEFITWGLRVLWWHLANHVLSSLSLPPGGRNYSFQGIPTENWTLKRFSSVQSLSRVRLFATPWIAARQASLSIFPDNSSESYSHKKPNVNQNSEII